MLIIECPRCDEQQLAGNVQILSTHRTSEGLVGYIRCTAGHTVVHRFEVAYPKPKPPASVVELRKQQLLDSGDEGASMCA